MQLFNIHCGGVVRYHAQFAAPDRQLAAADTAAAQKACAASCMAFDPAAVHAADLLGLSASFVPLAELCRAALWATTCQSFTHQREWRGFDDAPKGDEAGIAMLGAGRSCSKHAGAGQGERARRGFVAAGLSGDATQREIARTVRLPRRAKMR